MQLSRVAWYFSGMPLPPAVRRDRRAYNREQELKANPKAPLKRKRCKNCPKLFWKTRPNKLFCSEQCSREFREHGSAFGPLKEKLEKLVRSWMKSYQLDIDQNIIRAMQRLDHIELRLNALEAFPPTEAVQRDRSQAKR